MRAHHGYAPPIALATLALAACVAPEGAGPRGPRTGDGKDDSSAEAVFLEMEFDGEVATDDAWDNERVIEDQLLYTIGLLNGRNSVSRLDKVELSNVTAEADTAGLTVIRYHARVPLAWGDTEGEPPTELTLELPRNMSASGQTSFTDKYKGSCVDYGAHDVDSGSMWYYYRPERDDCALSPNDVTESRAAVRRSALGTTGRYPEYDEVWEDGTLEAVVIFGKYEDGAGNSDSGVAGYDRFVREARALLAERVTSTTPETLPANVGVETPAVELRAELADGHRVRINAILVDSIQSAPAEFNERYAPLSTTADFIAYNGHSGLGANIRALARKGRWVAGQYVVVFMNGCDSYAYVDSALNDAHAVVNPDDPYGTEHVDIVTNAMPSYFSSMPLASLAILRGLLAYDAPRTYEQIFRDVDTAQVILVSGEEDNTYTPGGGSTPTGGWGGLSHAGVLLAGEEYRTETPVLEAGRYRFAITGTGDADLYVRVGGAPTANDYDCRPYATDSNEDCVVSLDAPAAIHVLVQGYGDRSDFALSATASP